MLYLYRVKLISAILASLMLCLSGVSCDDIEVVDENGTETFVLIQDNHDHNGNSTEFDGCSPFCICHCCHTHIDIPYHPLESAVGVHQSPDKQSYYQDFFSKGVIYATWRPPQSA